MRIVIALGGNALLQRGQPMTAENQRANIRIAAERIAAVVPGNEIVIAHGNGPQVGLLALQAAAYDAVAPYPLDVLGAETEAMIGYVIEQELGNLLPAEQQFASPNVAAACQFATNTGNEAVIGALADIDTIVGGVAGTRVRSA